MANRAREAATRYFDLESDTELDPISIPDHLAYLAAYQRGYDEGQSVIPKWTYCKDAMPPEDALYLVCVPTLGTPYVGTAWYHPNTQRWSLLARVFCDEIIAWMPLPEPAK